MNGLRQTKISLSLISNASRASEFFLGNFAVWEGSVPTPDRPSLAWPRLGHPPTAAALPTQRSPHPTSSVPPPAAQPGTLRPTSPLNLTRMAGPKQPKLAAAPPPRLKVIVRRLPADLPEHIFNQSIHQWAPREVPEGHERVLTWSSYEKGKVRTT